MSNKELRQDLRIRGDNLAELARKLHSIISSDNPDASSVGFEYQTYSYPRYHEKKDDDDEGTIEHFFENLAALSPENVVHEDEKGNVLLDEESIVSLVSQYDKEGKMIFILTQSSNFDDAPKINNMQSHIENSDLNLTLKDKNLEEGLTYRVKGGKKEGKGAAYVGLQIKRVAYTRIEKRLMKAKQRLMKGYSGKVIRHFSKPEQREKVKDGLREVRGKLKTLADYISLCSKPLYMDIEIYGKENMSPREDTEALTIGKLFPKQVL